MPRTRRFGRPSPRLRRAAAVAAAAFATLAAVAGLSSPQSRPAGATAPVVTLGTPAKASSAAGVTSLSTPGTLGLRAGQLAVAVMGAGGPRGQYVASVSGAGLHWVRAARANAMSGTSEIWYAVAVTAVSGGSVAVTEHLPGHAAWLEVFPVNGSSAAMPIGGVALQSAPSGAPSVAVATTAAGSLLLAAGTDGRSAAGRAVAPGNVLIDQDAASAGGATFWVQSLALTPAAGSMGVLRDTAPSGDPFNMTGVEVRPATTVQPTATPTAAGTHTPAATNPPTPSPLPTPSATATAAPTPSPVPTTRPSTCSSNPWTSLAACGWPGPGNTGADLSQCPGGLTAHDAGLTGTITISTPGTVISCQHITGRLRIETTGVTVVNSIVEGSSGLTGTNANGTSVIFVDDGASATVSHVEINGHDGVHACIWHQGTSLSVEAVNCYGIDDGVFSWADTHFSPTTGDHFTIRDSWFHGFTTATANGHEDGYQTEGAANGLIEHNTYQMTTDADSAIAIWDSLKSSSNITVDGNLLTGGGFTVYAEDYSPGDGAPGDPAAVGGFSDTAITFTNNRFSTSGTGSGCVGAFGVWFTRPAWPPYFGGPTDGWHRSGNTVLETGASVDGGNPSVNGALCS